MKAILFRIIIIPLVLVAIILGIFCFIVVSFPYWIITGSDFMMDKYCPFCADVFENLNEIYN